MTQTIAHTHLTHAMRMAAIWHGLELFQARFPTITIVGACVDFSGEGDSGQLDGSSDLNTTNGYTDDDYSKPKPDLTAAYHTWRTFTFGVRDDLNLAKLIHEAAEHIMDTHGNNWPDWCNNNDGGRGSINFIVDGINEEDGQHYRRGVCVNVFTRVVQEDSHPGVYSEGVVPTP